MQRTVTPPITTPKFDFDQSPKMEVDQELIDVQVTVPSQLFNLYSNRGYQFFVINKNQIPKRKNQIHGEFDLADHQEHVSVIENPNIRPVENFSFTPPQAPTPMSHSTPFVKAEEINTLAEVNRLYMCVSLCKVSDLALIYFCHSDKREYEK